MQNATPQGIAGLTQKPQGQPPMPSPAKASPMAGLGGVDDRVSAYMSNPKPLEQRYAMTQDLLDLLALQKIKSQKDAAARQMQMQMAQQQAQNGEASMTVAQQREKEVNDLTKNELAQQRGDTAQHQAEEQQAKMQKMLGGVASAPGAATAAQPQAMAAGGIVGYAGPEGSLVGGQQPPSPERQEELRRKAREFSLSSMPSPKEMLLKRAQSKLMNGLELTPEEQAAIAESKMAQAPAAPPAPIAAGTPNLPVTPSAPLAPPQAPPQAAAPKPPGLPGLPGAAGNPAAAPQIQPGAVGPANDFGRKLEDASLKDAQLDVQKAKLDEEQRVQDKLALTPEQRKVYEEGIGGLQKMYQEQYDPERQRQEGLKRFLIGAGGRRYGELAGGAGSAMDYDAAQRADKLNEFKGIQGARTGLIDIDRANVKEGIGAGQKAYEQTAATKRTGLDAGSRLYGEDVKSRDTLFNISQTSRDKELDREVEKLRIQAQAAATQATREATTFAQQQSALNTVITNRARAVEAVSKRYDLELRNVEMFLQGNPKDAALLKKKEKLLLDRDAEINTVSKPFDNSEDLITSKMGGGSGTMGYTVTKKAPQ